MLLLLSSIASAQSYFFKEYNVSDGLPFVQVSTICQDEKGYLWTGGYGGLSKFDGNVFKNFNKEDGLSSTLINTINLDSENRLWIGTSKGLNFKQNDSIHTFPPLFNHPISLISSDSDQVYIASKNSIYTISDLKIADTLNLPKEKSIHSLLIRNDTLWIGTNSGLYFSTEKSQLDSLVVYDGINIQCLYQDNDTMYVGHSRGFCKISPSDTVFHNYKSGLIGSGVSAIYRIDDGAIWLATEFGINEYDNNRFKLINVGEHRGSNQIIHFYRDREDNIWICTMYGLYKTSGNAFKNYSFADGLMSSFIFQIQKDKQNNLWIGTRNDGIYKYNEESFYHYNTNHGLLSNSAKAVMPIGDSVFVGTNKGLSIFYKNKFKNHKVIDDISISPTNVIYQSSDKCIWLGSNDHLLKLKNNGDLDVIKDIPVEGQVWAIYEDKHKTIWVGTYQGGLYRIAGDSIEFVNPLWGIDNDNVLGITEDGDENLWFATFEGILKWNRKTNTTQSFNTKHGLNSYLIYTIVYDSTKNKIWAGTNQGITEIDLNGDSKYPTIINLGRNDGFTGVECNTHGTYLDSNGVIWFGTVNGLISFDQSNYRNNDKPNLIHINKTSIYYKDTLLQNNAVLPYFQNNISFDYIGLCLSNPSKVRYQYRLVGSSNEWTPPITETKAVFSSLEPGKYIFQVKSMNNSGIWNSSPIEFAFTISPPYWQTWWFRITLAGSIIALVSFIFYYRVQQINNKNELARRFDQMKLQALRAQMNPHFLFNSLNSIQHFINSNEKREANKYLSKFAKLMRLTLDNSKKQGVSIFDEINALELYLELEKLRFEDKFSFEINVDSNIDLETTYIPSMLIQPFIENSIIHGFNQIKYKGKITVAIGKAEEHIICSINDNGIGREASRIKQSQSVLKKRHESAGLTLTTERLNTFNEYYKEQLKVDISDLTNESGEPQGTSVVLTIPIINLFKLN